MTAPDPKGSEFYRDIKPMPVWRQVLYILRRTVIDATNFSGRAARREMFAWNLFVLFSIIPAYILGAVAYIRWPFVMMVCIFALPSVVLSMRRLQDTGLPGWLSCISITIVALLALSPQVLPYERSVEFQFLILPIALVWATAVYLLPGVKGINRYGTDPREAFTVTPKEKEPKKPKVKPKKAAPAAPPPAPIDISNVETSTEEPEEVKEEK